MTVEKSEKFCVYKSGSVFLCVQPGGQSFFWGDQIGMAVRGRNPQKLKACVVKKAAKGKVNPDVFWDRSTICRVEVGLDPALVKPKRAEEYVDIVLVTQVQDNATGYFGYSADGKPSPMLAKAHGVTPSNGVPIAVQAKVAGDKMCRYIMVTPVRQIFIPTERGQRPGRLQLHSKVA